MGNMIKRKPFFAFLFSLLTPGLGQLYNGEPYKAIIIYLSGLLIAAVIISGDFFSSFKGMLISIGVLILFLIAISVEAIYSAIKIKAIDQKKYNRWYIYFCIIMISTFLVSPSIKYLIPYKGIKMRANSMAPTLLADEYFIVDKNYFKKHSIKKGDLVVFAYPPDPSKDFLKRVIGLPNDKIQIRDKVLFINDEPQTEVYIYHADSRILPESPVPRDNFGPVVVPPNSVFVLGDNRDNSYDSRFWKFVNISALKGKALYIYWSKDRDRVGREIK